ncbi:50S ribosomal subunit L30 [Cordyceps militaris]|uniref:Large ribosomal subunit protein mL46 n=1 Tax=Cordyceps militaris TaxID=73501 RepID=A0A2H4SVC6_CORMI|nr:50S ribosomal subunit L30 [Cordyceps militaris]
MSLIVSWSQDDYVFEFLVMVPRAFEAFEIYTCRACPEQDNDQTRAKGFQMQSMVECLRDMSADPVRFFAGAASEKTAIGILSALINDHDVLEVYKQVLTIRKKCLEEKRRGESWRGGRRFCFLRGGHNAGGLRIQRKPDITIRAINICSRCAATRTHPLRFYSAASVIDTTTATTAPSSSQPPPAAAAYDIRSGLILTRPPLLTRPLHPFESAFFFYQKRLEERLNTAFIPSIYYKPDTPRRLDWDLKVKERQGTVAKELGAYHGHSATAWDDELLVGDPLSAPETATASLLRDAQARISDDAEVIAPEDLMEVPAPRPRRTEADERGDVRRLDRKLDQTLYLVVKGKDGWGFPADVLAESENLHVRALQQAAGVNMNTWIVGRVPVAHLIDEPTRAADGAVQKKGCKTFYLRGRIMAGQADLAGNSLGYTDFQWLTREELEQALPAAYFRGVRNMMSDR